MLKYQKTISKDIVFDGIGIHSGKKSLIRLKPAKENNGIIFYKNNQKIELDINNISSDFLCTSISKNNETIKTSEHLLSALFGLGISNLEIEVEGDEIPILDGSSFIFVQKLLPLLKEQNILTREILLDKIISISGNSKSIIAFPSDNLKITYILDYNNLFPFFSYETFLFDNIDSYINKISKARTFGFMKDAERILSLNMALGTNKENTLLIEKDFYLSDLRYKNEVSKHKVLDFLGDLFFLGNNIKAEFFCYKTGHKEHLEIVKKIYYYLALKNY